MFDEYRRRALPLLPERAFLRTDRLDRLFVTNAPLFADADEVIARLTGSGFLAEKRGTLIAFGPRELPESAVCYLKTGDVRALREDLAAALRTHDEKRADLLSALERNGRFHMKLTYLRHSCFAIENDEGYVLVTDPFDAHVGYPVPSCHADVVTVSHGHGDHCYTDALSGPKRVLSAAGKTEACGFTVEGFPSFHDDVNGAKRGANVIFRISCGGVSVVHLGDLGHLPDEETAAALSGADALLIPIGGFYTIDTKTAVKVIGLLKPKLAIGMHYKQKGNGFPISDAEEFKALTGAADPDACTLELPAKRTGAMLLSRKDA